MATTNKGIYYPNDYSQVADVPADLKKLAESVDKAIDDIPQYDDSDIKKDIQTIQQEQQTQNTSIQNNTEELELLKNNLPDPITTEQSEEITVKDAMNYYSQLDVSGNSTQIQTEQGANLWWDNDTMQFNSENRQNLTTQTIKAGTYKFSCDVSNLVLGTNTSLTLFADNIYYDGETDGNFSWLDNITENGRISKEVVIPKDISTLRLKLSATQATNGGLMTVSNLCLRTDDSDEYVEYVSDSPSPDFPSEIKNCKDSINIKIENENKYVPFEASWGAFRGIELDFYLNGTVRLNGTAAASGGRDVTKNVSTKNLLKAGKSYTMYSEIVSGTGQTGYVYLNRVSDNSGLRFCQDGSVRNFTQNEDVEVYWGINVNEGNVFDNLVLRLGLFEGTYTYEEIKKKFVVHEEKIVTFPLKEGQLLHAGDYLTSDGVHHVKQTCVFDGTENIIIAYNDETIDSFRIAINSKYNQMLGYQIDDKCSHFKNLGHTPAWGRQANTFALSSEGYLYIFFEKNKITSETEAKNWITEQYNSGTPLTAEGTLEEEYVEPYTEEQQAVRNELQRLILYKGYNYITCTDETKCKMQLTYRPDNNIKIKSLEERVAALENSEVTA